MANVRTVISIERPLFERADGLARELKIPRSRLFALALQEFLSRHESRQLLERINAAYGDSPDRSEGVLRRRMRRQHRRIVEGEW